MRTSARLRAWGGLCLRLLFLLFLLSSQAMAAQATNETDPDLHPLQPADTTSPQATVRSFQENAREVARRIRARLAPAEVDRAVSKLLETLDLSGLPPADLVDQGGERAVLLAEILGRIELPPLETIPDAAAVKAGGLNRWTIPDSKITIARTKDGPHAGEFQFTWETVQQLPAFYERVKHLPPRPGSLAGFYDEWSDSPGPWIPRSWTKNLPAFTRAVIWHQTIWQWLAALTIVVLTFLVILVAYRLARRIDRVSGNDPRRGHLARLVATLIAMALLEFAHRLLDDAVNLTGQRLFVLDGMLRVALYGGIGWAIILSLDALGASLLRLHGSRTGSIDAAMVRVVVRLVAITTVTFLAIWMAESLGVPVTPLIASLGVGGLAIALAIRPTLENVIGGIVLFTDKPVRVGDFCRYGDDIGTVEEIGLRSTTIRSLERTTVTIPNTEFAQMKLENFAKRDLRLLNTVLQLRYETTPEQLRWILVKLRELLLGHPMVTPEPARVRFVDFDSYSKNLEIFAYLRCQDQDTFLAIKEDILLRVEDIIREGGSGFAFPSQTTYFSRAEGLDDKSKGNAETQVGFWRTWGRFPFPEFDKHEREKLRNVLDYPPKGSPDYSPHQPALETKGRTVSSTFAAEELADIPSLVAKLRTATPIAEHLLSQFSTETRELLSKYQGGADAKLAAALVNDLNAVVCGPPLYDEKRFQTIDLGPDTEELLERAPEGRDLQHLNQLLLQDAYPTELSRRKVVAP